VVIAEHVGDDEGRHLLNVLAHGRCPAGTLRTPSAFSRPTRASGCIDCPARRPGNSQRESRLVAVFTSVQAVELVAG
jgi:hypothetical protein